MGQKQSKKIKPVSIYESSGQILNLRGKIIHPQEDHWFNLGTNRMNKKIPAGVIFDGKFHVFGTSNQMEAFYYINHITTGLVCNPTTNSVVYAPNTEDIEKVPENYIDNICYFNLIGLRTKGKITYITDGDTLDIVFHLKLSFLFNPRPNFDELEGKKTQISLMHSTKPTSPKIQESGLFIKMNCRLNRMDAAESKTAQGKLATKIMTDLYAKTNNIVYLDCQGFDIWGRLLVDLYSDPEYKNYLNYYLIDHPDPKLGVLATYYEGGTKSEILTSLPKA